MLESQPDRAAPGGDHVPPPPNAFEDVYLLFAPRLRKIAIVRFGVPPGDAEALVQDVFTTFFMHAKAVEKVEPYLIGAICNASRNYLRRSGATNALFCDEKPCAATTSDDFRAIVERKMLLSRLMARVGPGCRELLHRYYMKGEDTQTIAAELDLTRGTVKVNLHKCRQRLLAAYHSLIERP